jgi:O-antigen biosynthesis protein
MASLIARNYLNDQFLYGYSAVGPSPLVSVILPTHSRRLLLERAIRSVLEQTFEDFELLVMDDGSTDGSSDLIEAFRAEDPRIIHIRHDQCSGLPGLRVNEGIELARGDYLAFQFDDDCWRPQALNVLVSEMRRHDEPVVVVGHAQFSAHSNQWILPQVELNYVNLYSENRLANNSVLLPRVFMNHYGLYDCHIGMRRLCDWDLWLRLFKQVPFIVIDDIISDVFEYNQGAIALTVPWDLPLFRFFHDIPRNEILTLDRWRDYPVDSLRPGGIEFDKDFRRRLYEQHIVPYYFKFRHQFPWLEGFQPTLPPSKKTVLLTKYSYDVTNDITLNHYDKPASERGNFKAHFEALPQVTANWTAEADSLLLVRTVEEEAKTLAEMALMGGKPVGYYLDDDLVHFHEFGPQFDYLSPGTPYHQNLLTILGQVDAVWVTTDPIGEAVRPFNPRVIPHNNSVPEDWLPPAIRRREPEKPVKIGYVGTAYRIDEFRLIWEGLVKVAKKFGDRLVFEFWGIDVSSLPPLASPSRQQPFTFSYFNYLKRLKESEFDILLSPLLESPRPRLAKSLIKYHETAVAGALGIFSKVSPYHDLPENLTCLKAENTAEAWHDALERALTMPGDQFDLMRRRLLEHVREEFTEKKQIHLHEAAWWATEFHAKTRRNRYPDGRPRVIYVIHSANFGGGEIQLWRRLRLARRYGIEPIVVLHRLLEESKEVKQLKIELEREDIQLKFVEFTFFTTPRRPTEFTSDRERMQIKELFSRCSPALVHSVTFVPSIGQVCQEMGIPHVASLYQIEDSFAWPNGHPGFVHAQMVHSDSLRYASRWSYLLGVEKFCSRPPVQEEIFRLGQRRWWAGWEVPEKKNSPWRLVTAGTIQERKNQRELLEAVGRLSLEGWDCLLDVYGYTHFYPEYLKACQQTIKAYGLEKRVAFKGFTHDLSQIIRSADLMLMLSGDEGFSGVIAEAMAGGTLVVSTPVGGIPELLIDGQTGILCQNNSVEAMVDGIHRAILLPFEEKNRIIEQARRVARSEFHPNRIASDLFQIYCRSLDLSNSACNSSGPNVVFVSNLSSEQSLWKVAQKLLRIRLRLIPLGSSRERFMYYLVRTHSLWRSGGLKALLQGLLRKLSPQKRKP